MMRNFLLIRRDPILFLSNMQAAHGNVLQFPIPRPGVYLVSDPDAVKEVLVTNARQYSKRTIQYDSLSLVTGNGLLTADDPPWRAHRSVLQPAFHHEALSGIAEHVTQAVKVRVDEWEQLDGSTPQDVEAEMMQTSLQVVAGALFGSQWNDQARGITEATVVALDAVVARARNPLAPPLSWPTPGARKLRRSIGTLDDAVSSVLRTRKLNPGEVQSLPDVVDLLLASAVDPGALLDDQAIRDELVTMLVAGHETVGSAMTWMWFLLASNPGPADSLHAELDAVLDRRLPRLSDLESLPYTRAVVEETLRLYPPAWVITRKALADQELSGHEIPAGSLIIMSPWIVHRNTTAWDAPEQFRPERFLDGSSSARRAAYLPFGMGARLCIGRDMALLECTLILATIASRFRLQLPLGHEVIALPSVTVRPTGGLPMLVEPR